MNKHISFTGTMNAHGISDIQITPYIQRGLQTKQLQYNTPSLHAVNVSSGNTIIDMDKFRSKKPLKVANVKALEQRPFVNIKPLKHKQCATKLIQISVKEHLIYNLLSLSCLSLSDFLQQAVGLITAFECLNVQRACAILIRPDCESQTMDLACSYNLTQETEQQCRHIEIGTSLSAQTIVIKTPQYHSSVKFARNYRRPPQGQKGTYHVPIMVENRLLGVMILFLKPNHVLHDNQRDLLLKLTDVLATEIMRHRTEEMANHLAYHHNITNLPNRQKFTEHLQGLIANP